MSNLKRDGKRKKRGEAPKRQYRPGNFCIVTDTKETEKQYFSGIQNRYKDVATIRVVGTHTNNLLNEANKQMSLSPQYNQTWIVFDRDRVPDFDNIISKAEKNNINVAWSNPCIEVWFHAYYNSMPPTSLHDSTSCCRKFGELFRKKNNQDYEKSARDIYKKLLENGDEEAAIKRAKARRKHYENSGLKPSEMHACTMVHTLLEEIISTNT